MDGYKPSIVRSIQQQQVAEQIAEEFCTNLSVLVLVQGILADGQPHYAYLRVPAGRYREFKLAEQLGNIDIRAFGEVLAHGVGLYPPEHIRQEMKQKYGANPDFLENLISEGTAMADAMFQNETNAAVPQ